MQHAVERARDCPAGVMRAVALSDERSTAAAALARLLEIEHDLADELIDLKLAEFVGRARKPLSP